MEEAMRPGRIKPEYEILMISFWDFQDEGMQITRRTPLFFAARGHKVTFMVHSETTAAPSRKETVHPNLRVLRFDLPLKWMNRIHGLRRLRQLLLFAVCCIWGARKIYRGQKGPDVIYAAEADAVLIGAFLRRIYHVPLVTRFYGVSRLEGNFNFESGSLRPLGAAHFFSKLAVTRHADLIIVTDDGSRGSEIVRALNPHSKNVRFWKNGVDIPDVLPQDIEHLRSSLGLDRDAFTLMTLCRLDPWKGVDLAIRAMADLPDEVRKKLKLLIVGQGPELSSLHTLVGLHRLEEHVIFVGAVPHDQVYAYYHLVDAFLSLYRYSNVGNPLWEALNAGRCIVTLNTGATGEIIQDGINGRLLSTSRGESELIKDISRAVLELYSSPSLREKLRNGAKAYSQKYVWSWDKRLGEELGAVEDIVRCRDELQRRP